MTPLEALKKYLEKVPKARERRFKDEHIVKKLKQKYVSIDFVDDKELVEFVKDYTTYDRYWRKLLHENEDLRGEDYNDKKILEQETEIDLGYEAGYHGNVKKLKQIAEEESKEQRFDRLYKKYGGDLEKVKQAIKNGE